MKSGAPLGHELEIRLEQIGRADILVGIPSFNNEGTIAHVVRAAEYGLGKYFPKFKAVLVNSDGGSSDRTREIVRETSVYSELDTILIDHPVQPVRSIAAPYHGISGKGSAFKAIFEAAQALNARVCVVLDADLRSITPEWIEMLAGPIALKGYDYVSPFYSRHKYDGTITNSIVYPLTRALYGRRVRQPIGGDFGFSGELAKFFLNRDVWGTDVARYGIDVWMTTTAMNEGYKLCQAFLGAKIHDAKDPSKALGPMFTQVVGTVFHLMGEYAEHWKKVRGSTPTAMYGFRSEVSPEPLAVDVQAMIEKFKTGVKDRMESYAAFLPKDRIGELSGVARLEPDRFSLPMELWTKAVYDFAVAYRKAETKSMGKTTTGEIVEGLLPIYFGRTASFCMETDAMPTFEAEELIEELCDKYEELKTYLLQRWESTTLQGGQGR